MRLRATVLMLLVAGLLAAPATAAVPYWWWTNVHASRGVVAKNPQLWPGRDAPAPHTTITKSACKGYGLVKRTGTARYYRHFVCAVTHVYDTPDPNYGSGPFSTHLFCDTTKARPLGLSCRLSA